MGNYIHASVRAFNCVMSYASLFFQTMCPMPASRSHVFLSLVLIVFLSSLFTTRHRPPDTTPPSCTCALFLASHPPR